MFVGKQPLSQDEVNAFFDKNKRFLCEKMRTLMTRECCLKQQKLMKQVMSTKQNNGNGIASWAGLHRKDFGCGLCERFKTDEANRQRMVKARKKKKKKNS